MSNFEINQSSLDRIYDQLETALETLGKARRRGNSFMVQSAQQAVDCLHATAEEMEAVLADRRFAA